MAADRPAASPMRARDAGIAALALVALIASVALSSLQLHAAARWPLYGALAVGGIPLLVSLTRRILAGKFGSDLLAGVAIVTAVLLDEYVVAAVIVLMLSGGQALEQYATRRASAVLDALARRNPTRAHRRIGATLVDVPLEEIQTGDVLAVRPHEICPVDGIILEGSSSMDESYLSGEPFLLRKTIGGAVISGAINQDGLLIIRALRPAAESRYARIVAIVREADQRRPPIQRLADRLGAWYTPLAVGIAAAGWAFSGDPNRFLAVIVIATPCPLLLAIPVAIIGGVSLAAERSILIKDPAVLERLDSCRTVIFDKTGTLTLGRPALTEVLPITGWTVRDTLSLAASLEQYSRHPLAPAVTQTAERDGVPCLSVSEMSERPGEGLAGRIGGRWVRLTSRHGANTPWPAELPSETAGLECVMVVDGRIVALLRFRDALRLESGAFVGHLSPRHGVTRVVLTSGDRESEVRYLAGMVGIDDVRFEQSPEQKLSLVESETRRQPTLFVGDGLNDAAAMACATAAVALGEHESVTAESAHAVVLDGSLAKVDELMHIARRTKRVAMQSAVGGMALSVIGMGLAVGGWLPALAGAIAQEVLDAAAILNALRAAIRPAELTDFSEGSEQQIRSRPNRRNRRKGPVTRRMVREDAPRPSSLAT